MWNLIRWVSPRTIKETFVPPRDYRYPFLGPDQKLRSAVVTGASRRTGIAGRASRSRSHATAGTC